MLLIAVNCGNIYMHLRDGVKVEPAPHPICFIAAIQWPSLFNFSSWSKNWMEEFMRIRQGLPEVQLFGSLGKGSNIGSPYWMKYLGLFQKFSVTANVSVPCYAPPCALLI